VRSLKSGIKLRGHHLICLHFFSGEGYNPEFVENLKEVMKRVEDGAEIEVYSGPDDICKKCPYLKGEMCLYTEDADAGIREMDRKAGELLKIKNITGVKWQVIRRKIPEIFSEWEREYCEDCDWRKVCEKTIPYQRLTCKGG